MAAVGDDEFGRVARSNLQREGIDGRFIKTVSGEATGVALILVDDGGENLISVASGANMHLHPEDIDAIPDQVFSRAKVFLCCLESPIATVVRGLQRARDTGLMTVLNPAPAFREVARPEVLSLVDVLTPNALEAALLNGIDSSEPDAAARSARRLQELGCGSVVVTLGAEGCLLAQNTIEQIEGCTVQPVDATAAGDAFNGALTVRLAEGNDLSESVRWANRAAALSVTRRGAQPSLPTRQEIDRFAD